MCLPAKLVEHSSPQVTTRDAAMTTHTWAGRAPGAPTQGKQSNWRLMGLGLGLGLGLGPT